ncbi:response regulator NasT [Silvimonas terrae]|uniref:Response regulator NasT n=1 Tax=Silvimonas terrae TaxID=300266 RepID=A0A840RCT2_9NEIS|nr:ANTAR domain-containing protein [Silvimonas terrae]MBB5190183.1 response regulator NasT [Silvimonas terrae]
MLRILLVTDTAKPIGELRETLLQQGYDVLTDAASSTALLSSVERQRPDVVIIDTESPSRDTLEQLSVMNSLAPRPVVMFTPDADQQHIRAAVGAGVTTYVVDGLDADKLSPIIEVAMVRFAEDDKLRQRLAKVEQQLADRKLIDRAKGLLMDKRGLSEAAAFEMLRTQAMKQGITLAEMARQVIAMADLLG